MHIGTLRIEWLYRGGLKQSNSCDVRTLPLPPPRAQLHTHRRRHTHMFTRINTYSHTHGPLQRALVWAVCSVCALCCGSLSAMSAPVPEYTPDFAFRPGCCVMAPGTRRQVSTAPATLMSLRTTLSSWPALLWASVRRGPHPLRE